MKNATGRKRLACFVAHSPHLESCVPVLIRLGERGHIDIDLILNKRMLKTESGLSEVLSQLPLQTHVQSRFRMEVLSCWEMWRADAVLSYGDPIAFRNKFRLRDPYLRKSGTPTIFLQHGLIQEGVNLDSELLSDEWYARLILWWTQAPSKDTPFLSDEIRQRVKSVGFIKKNFLPQREFPGDLLQFVNKFKKRILVCTSIPTDNNRFAEDRLQSLYRMLDEFCARHAEYLIMLRPHRARNYALGVDSIDNIEKSRENFIVMDRHSGPFAYSTIHHSLQLSDMVISHASSAILDAIYSDQPVAVLQNDWPPLNEMTQINELKDLEGFVATADSFDVLGNPIRSQFGELDNSLDNAAEAIEQFMLNAADN